MPLESVPGCKKSSMRTAVPERDSKSLSAAARNIGAELTWRTQKCQAQQIRRDGHQCASFVGGFYESRVVMNFTPGIRVLHQCAEYLVIKLEEVVSTRNHLNPQGLGPGDYHVDDLGMAILGNEKGISAFFQAVAHGHGLRGGSGFIEQ